MTQEVNQTDKQAELPYWAFECEREDALYACSGFKVVGGNVQLNFGYAIYPVGVILMVVITIGDNEPRMWRRFMTSKERALDAAWDLVGDCEQYLYGDLRTTPRDPEDLDADCFVHHLDMRLNNGLH